MKTNAEVIVEKRGKLHFVELCIGNQGFTIGEGKPKCEALWYKRMLEKALSNNELSIHKLQNEDAVEYGKKEAYGIITNWAIQKQDTANGDNEHDYGYSDCLIELLAFISEEQKKICPTTNK